MTEVTLKRQEEKKKVEKEQRSVDQVASVLKADVEIVSD